MNYLGDFSTGATVYVYFDTFVHDTRASVTLTGLLASDIEIYKNGSMTQRSSDAGYTLLDTDGIDLDLTTGIHGFSIDLSNDTDAGFFAAGNDYTVVVASVTVDGVTVNFVAAQFSIENRARTSLQAFGTGPVAYRDKVRRWKTINVEVLTGTAAYANVFPAKTGFTSFITKITLSITTHVNGDVYLIDDDGAGAVIAAHTDATAAVGVPSVVTWDFGVAGTPVTALANVDVSHSSTGVGRIHIEGYYSPS